MEQLFIQSKKYLNLDKYHLSIIAISFASGLIRIYQLDQHSLWFDEALSFFYATTEINNSIESMLTIGMQQSPLYFLILRLFVNNSHVEFNLRLLSVIFGTLSVPLLAELGKEIKGKTVGLFVAIFLSVNPFSIWYSREARMYSLLCFLAIGSMLFFIKFIRNPSSKGFWFFQIIFFVIGFYTHYFAFFVPLVQLVFLILTFKINYRLIKIWFTIILASGIAFLPWILLLLSYNEFYVATGTSLPPTPFSLVANAINFTTGFDGEIDFLEIVVLISSGFLCISAARSKSKTNLILFTWLLVPPLTTYLISLRFPMYLERYLIISLPALLLLVSTGIFSITNSKTRLLFGSLMFFSMAFGGRSILSNSENYIKADWRGLISTLHSSGAFQSDTIVTLYFEDLFLFNAYGQSLDGIYPIIRGNETVIPNTRNYFESGEMWLVLPYPNQTRYYISNCDNSSVNLENNPNLKGWHDSISSYLIEIFEFDCLRLEHFQFN